VIIDFGAWPSFAAQHTVLDARTGEDLGASELIFYADDVAGAYRRYITDGGGGVVLRPGPLPSPAWEEVRRPIRIVPRRRAPAFTHGGGI
jgi:hypothetical protein